MQYVRNFWALGLSILFIGAVGFGLWQYEKTIIPSFPLNRADQSIAWDFKGVYSGNAELEARGTADIAHLTGLLGKGQYDDYDLYIGIGNDYDLLGDGKAAYKNYNRAIAVHEDKGLAFVNLGHLMADMGAYYTAADAYAKATAAEPSVLEYHLERLQYLTDQFPNDKERLLAAFTEVSTQFGDTAEVLQIEAQWLTKQGRYADAIAAWERAKLIMPPGRDTSAIDREIARLKAKQ